MNDSNVKNINEDNSTDTAQGIMSASSAGTLQIRFSLRVEAAWLSSFNECVNPRAE